MNYIVNSPLIFPCLDQLSLVRNRLDKLSYGRRRAAFAKSAQ